MRTLNDNIVDAQTNATTSFPAINAFQLYAATFIATFTDAAAAGTIKVQASNDWSNTGNLGAFVPSATSWVDIPLATIAVVAGASASPPMPLTISYRWLRLVWTRSAGAGTMTVQMNAQSY